MKSSVTQPGKEDYAQQLQAILRENGGDLAALHAAVQDLFKGLVADWSRAVEDLKQENAVLQGEVEIWQSLHRNAHTEARDHVQIYAEELAAANEELAIANEELNSQNRELAAARKIAEAERERYYELFNTAPEGYLVTDSSGRILEANQTVGVLLAIHKDSLIGRNILNFAREKNRANLRARMSRAIHGEGRQTFEADLLPLMEGPMHVSASIVSVRAGEEAEPSLRWIIQDIRDRKRAEEELRRLNREVEAARDEANLYVDILTHDIRNTENVSSLYAELLADSLEGDEAIYMANLQRSIKKSIEILGTISMIRQIHRRVSEPGLVDLDAIIRDTIEGYSHGAIRYEGTHHRVFADNLLPVIFNNLIGNAVKHGGPGVEIAIRVIEVDGSVRISVEDTGPGVPDEEKDAIFHRYEQQKRGVGEGLGLYLVQILVRRYGGRIWVEDRVPGHPEEGAAFQVALRKAV
ncbi:MAG: PAS domain S-box protein [Methanomicrobiales archaeon]|nr:PAS domain S-box protein [Methanomicrobiales archaeon]